MILCHLGQVDVRRDATAQFQGGIYNSKTEWYFFFTPRHVMSGYLKITDLVAVILNGRTRVDLLI